MKKLTMIWMVALQLVTSCIVTPVYAQVVKQVNISQVYPSPTGNMKDLWDRVVECSGSYRDTARTFEEIKWFERDTLPGRFPGYIREGERVRPDSIFITKGFLDDDWVIAHEMLHHALNLPVSSEMHPFFPFMYPCDLLIKPDEKNKQQVVIVTTYFPTSKAFEFRFTDPLTNHSVAK